MAGPLAMVGVARLLPPIGPQDAVGLRTLARAYGPVDGYGVTLARARKTEPPDGTGGLPERFRRFESLLRNRVRRPEDFPLYCEFLTTLHPRWAVFLDTVDRLRDARIAAGETGCSGEAFAIDFTARQGPGTYCVRGQFKNRRTELADGIALALPAHHSDAIHELAHALPLEALLPELAALPYTPPPEFEPGKVSLAEVFHCLLHHVYQDEAIAALAEVLFYRDTQAAGIPAWIMFDQDECTWFEQAATTYATEGAVGFLQSQLYIGRNHRVAYNQARLRQLAVMAWADPRLLQDPDLPRLLEEHGIDAHELAPGHLPSELCSREGGTQQALPVGGATRAPVIEKVQALLDDPTSAKGFELIAALAQSGIAITLDLPTIIAQVQEFAALATGTQPKASATFIGREAATIDQVRILAEARRHVDRYAAEFEKAWDAAQGSGKPLDWSDTEGLLGLFRATVVLSEWVEPQERIRLETVRNHAAEILHQILGVYIYAQKSTIEPYFVPNILALEAARLRNDTYAIAACLRACLDSLFLSSGFMNLVVLPGTRLLATILDDPRVARHIDPVQVTRVLQALEQTVPSTVGKVGVSLNIAQLHELPITALNDLTDLMARLAPYHTGKTAALIPALLRTTERDPWDGRQTDLCQVWCATHPDTMPPSLLDAGLAFNFAGEEEWDERPDMTQRSMQRQTQNGAPTADLPRIVRYQQQLHRLRGGRPPTRVVPSDTERPDLGIIPTLFWLDAREDAAFLPAHVPRRHAGGTMPPAIRATTTGKLHFLHLQLEVQERATGEGPLDATILGTASEQFSGVLTSLWLSAATDHTIDAGALWVTTQLALRWAALAARNDQPTWAQDLLTLCAAAMETIAADLQEDRAQLLTEAHDELTLARELLPLQATTDAAARQALLTPIVDEYANLITLRRTGYTPIQMIRLAYTLGNDPDLRTEVTRLIELAMDHTARFDPEGTAFRAGVAGLIATIDTAYFIHAEKDRLMGLLMETLCTQLLPKDQRIAIGSVTDLRRTRRAYEWLEGMLLSDTTLATLALYPRAERTLFARTQRFLAELGSLPLPRELHGRVVATAFRLLHYMQRAHPELTEEAGRDRLARVSRDPAYQEALAECFPSRRVMVDVTLPVPAWDPIQVRRGMPDPAAAWVRLREALTLPPAPSREGRGSQPDGFAKVLAVYSAFALQRAESSGRPTIAAREITDLIQAMRARAQQRATITAHATAGVGLDLYTMARGILSRQEQVLVDQLAQIPPIGFGLSLLEGAARNDRALTDREVAILAALCTAPTIGDARRLRELFLLVLAATHAPLSLKRLAVQGLSHGTGHDDVAMELIAHYERRGDTVGEAQFYALLHAYWTRVGQLPDTMGLLILEEEGGKDPARFWAAFDRMATATGELPSALALELVSLRHGKEAERFVHEARAYIAHPTRRDRLVFRQQLATLLPDTLLATQREEILATVDLVVQRQLARRERLELIRMGLPAPFWRLPREIRFLLTDFLRSRPQDDVRAQVAHLRYLSETQPDAEVLLQFMCDNGLENAGQWLATMVGMIPDAERRTYARLQTGVPASSWAAVQRTIETETGRRMEDLFAEIDRTPVASGKIGEVYRATLRDGSPAYVKVAPPSKRQKVEMAIATLREVATHYAEKEAALGFGTQYRIVPDLLREFADQLARQLDFRHERRNAWGIADDQIRVPEYLVDVDNSAPHVLIMRLAPGTPLARLTDAAECAAAATPYARTALAMFRDGTHHGDPHPGNALWDAATNQLTWIDWGVTDRSPQANTLFMLLIQTAGGNADEQVRLLQTLARPESHVDTERLRAHLAAEQPHEGTPADRLGAILAIANAEGLYLDRAAMRGIAYLMVVSGVVHDLDPTHDLATDLLATLGVRH